MKKPSLFISVIVLTIVVLSIIQITVSNNLSTEGVALGKLEDEISVYKKDNYLIREKLLVVSSLTNVASKSENLGFTEDKFRIILTPSFVVAIK